MLGTNFLGVRRIAIMQHTDCALAHRTDGDVRSDLAADRARESETWEFLTMPDPDEALRVDVDAVRTCTLLADGVRVEGWRYRVETGEVVQLIGS